MKVTALVKTAELNLCFKGRLVDAQKKKVWKKIKHLIGRLNFTLRISFGEKNPGGISFQRVNPRRHL